MLATKLCALTVAPLALFAVMRSTRPRFDPRRWPLEQRLAGEELAGAHERERSLVGDQRVVEEFYVARLARHVDVLVLGSSAVRAIDDSLFPQRSVHNAWVPWAMLEDLVIGVERYASVDRLPAEVVLGLTPDMLLGVKESGLPCRNWTDFPARYAHARQLLGLPAVGVRARRQFVDESRLSLDDLQRELVARLRPPPRQAQQPLADGVNRHRRLPSGAEVARALGRQQHDFRRVLDAFDTVDGERMALLAALVRYLRAHDVPVVLLLLPLRPDLHRVLSRYPLIGAIERSIRGMMAALGQPVVGSFDPQRAGCNADQFDDGVHVRVPCLETMLGAPQN